MFTVAFLTKINTNVSTPPHPLKMYASNSVNLLCQSYSPGMGTIKGGAPAPLLLIKFKSWYRYRIMLMLINCNIIIIMFFILFKVWTKLCKMFLITIFFLLLNFGKRQNQVNLSKKLIRNSETFDENNDELHTGGIGRNISSEDSPFRIIGKL